LRLVDGEHDVFGDGSVVCLPTHGHTPGHQSLRLRLNSGEIVLAADACYFCRTLRERRLPRYVPDREAMLASLDRLETLEKSGARIYFGHDPEFWRSVPLPRQHFRRALVVDSKARMGLPAPGGRRHRTEAQPWRVLRLVQPRIGTPICLCH
jgi:glyoxylase-like metal-dependent hydrolase (beta-lactamase superfamily II)